MFFVTFRVKVTAPWHNMPPFAPPQKKRQHQAVPMHCHVGVSWVLCAPWRVGLGVMPSYAVHVSWHGKLGEMESCNKRFAWFWELNLDKTAWWCLENEKNGGKLCKWVMIIWLVVFIFPWYFKWVFVCGKICRFLQRWCFWDTAFFRSANLLWTPMALCLDSLLHGKSFSHWLCHGSTDSTLTCLKDACSRGCAAAFSSRQHVPSTFLLTSLRWTGAICTFRITCQNGGWKMMKVKVYNRYRKVYWKVKRFMSFGTSLDKTNQNLQHGSPGVASVLATGATDGTGDASAGWLWQSAGRLWYFLGSILRVRVPPNWQQQSWNN